jgi:hypothetical protein
MGRVGKRPIFEERIDTQDNQKVFLYHDKDVGQEASHTMTSLLEARRILQKWFGIKINHDLPVILSSTTHQASFANLITGAIELQTLGRVSRDLVWHELVHTMMYQHMENIFGPAGSVFHVLWMPPWFIEGLAESISMSAGSSYIRSIEAYYALSGQWPSYASLHHLYNSGSSYQGYAVSAQFVAHLLKRGLAKHLAAFLEDFKHKTMIWRWPFMMLPVHKYTLPLDQVFYEYFKKSGSELYEEYKMDAQSYWRKRLQDTQPAAALHLTSGVRINEDKIFALEYKNARYFEQALDYRHGKIFSSSHLVELSPQLDASPRINFQGKLLYFVGHRSLDGKKYYRLTDNEGTIYFQREGYGSQLIVDEDNEIVFKEVHKQRSSICRYIESSLVCDMQRNIPEDLDIISSSPVVVKHSRESLQGNFFDLYDKRNQLIKRHSQDFVRILTMGQSSYALVNLWDAQQLWRLDEQKRCEQAFVLGNMVYNIHVIKDKILFSSFYGKDSGFFIQDPESLVKVNCPEPNIHSHQSPLMAAVGEENLSLTEALELEQPSQKQAITTPQITESKAAKTRFRHVLSVPWFGSDSHGMQMAFLSVPIMDHMQDYELRAFFGYGLYSRYANTALDLRVARFWPQLYLGAYREQVWNGEHEQELRFVDEIGSRLLADIHLYGLEVDIQSGLRHSLVKSYIGPSRDGRITEFFLGGDKQWQIKNVFPYQSAKVSTTPQVFGSAFNYTSYNASMGAVTRFYDFSWDLGMDYAQTTGSKKRELTQYYIPYKVTTPGESFNRMRIGLSGGGGLFAPIYGDQSMRFKSHLTTPLIKDVDILVGLVYWDSISFSQYINYGRAWNDEMPKFILSHGYNMDAHFDFKGLKMRAGIGTGQVWTRVFEVYSILAFDALF